MLRFWSKVNKTSTCWEWTAFKVKGYGRFSFNSKVCLAHRYSAYEAGLIPDVKSDLCVLHKCDNPSCVNPDHLFVGTVTDNMVDKVKKNRQAKGERMNSRKLTTADVLAIRADPRSCYKLADEYGVSFSYVSKIKRKENWRHI